MIRAALAGLVLAAAPIVVVGQDEPPRGGRADRGFVTITFDLAGSGYNRVEGLPFLVGLRGRSEGPTPFRGEAALIIRSDPSRRLDQVGFSARAERVLPGGHFVVGAEGHSEVRAIEDRGLSNIDNSLTAIGFHRDHRDYHDAIGLSAYALYAPRGGDLVAGFEFRAEQHETVEAGFVGTLFNNNQPWRPQPLVAQGWLRTVSAGVRFDNRNRRRFLAGGWFAEADLTARVGGTLELPLTLDRRTRADVRLPDFGDAFAFGSLDARRYTNVGNLRLLLRGVAAGALSDDPLPPQFQHAPGGRGTLPGLDGLPNRPEAFRDPAASPVNERALDCGARADRVVATAAAFGAIEFYPYYGCDRYVLLQAQLEGYLGFRIGDQTLDMVDPRINMNFELVPRWVVFVDAARAWSNGDFGPLARSDEDWVYDAGAGIAFGDLGFFAAVPLQDEGNRDVRFLVRVGARF